MLFMLAIIEYRHSLMICAREFAAGPTMSTPFATPMIHLYSNDARLAVAVVVCERAARAIPASGGAKRQPHFKTAFPNITVSLQDRRAPEAPAKSADFYSSNETRVLPIINSDRRIQYAANVCGLTARQSNASVRQVRCRKSICGTHSFAGGRTHTVAWPRHRERDCPCSLATPLKMESKDDSG